MVKKTQSRKAQIQKKIAEVNKIVTKLEGEVEKALKKLRSKGEVSSAALRKSLDELIERVNAYGLYQKANEKKSEVIDELRKLSDDLVLRVGSMDWFSQKRWLSDVKTLAVGVIQKIESFDVLDQAKDKVAEVRQGLFEALDIATLDQVRAMQSKITQLEKKLQKTRIKKAA